MPHELLLLIDLQESTLFEFIECGDIADKSVIKMGVIYEFTCSGNKQAILRSLTTDDAEAAYLWLSDERVTKYMPYATYTCISAVRDWLDSLKEEDNFHFGFVLKENGLVIGSGDIDFNKGFWDFGYNIRYYY